MASATEVQNQLKDANHSLITFIKDELGRMSVDFGAFKTSVASNPNAKQWNDDTDGVARAVAQLLAEGLKLAEQEQAPPVVPSQTRVDLNPQLKRMVNLMVQNLQTLRNSSFKEDADALKAIVPTTPNSREKSLYTEIRNAHENLRQNLPHDIEIFMQRAPPDLRAAVSNVVFQSPIGQMTLRDGIGWFQAQGDWLKKWEQAILEAVKTPPPIYKVRFQEALVDNRDYVGLKVILADPQLAELVKCIRMLRNVLIQYERQYSQLDGVLGLVLKLMTAYYEKPAEFASIAGKK